MAGTETRDIETVRISSWAAPTAKDMVLLESLSDTQYQMLLKREIQKGFESGATTSTTDDAWNEALRRVTAAAHVPDAL